MFRATAHSQSKPGDKLNKQLEEADEYEENVS